MSLSNGKYSSINDDLEVSKYTAGSQENVIRSDQYEAVEIKWVSYYIVIYIAIASYSLHSNCCIIKNRHMH